jgi:hypothetical protein
MVALCGPPRVVRRRIHQPARRAGQGRETGHQLLRLGSAALDPGEHFQRALLEPVGLHQQLVPAPPGGALREPLAETGDIAEG